MHRRVASLSDKNADSDMPLFALAYNHLVTKKYEPVVDAIMYTTCPRCKYDKAVRLQLQQRSLDEEATTVVECDKCNEGRNTL